jgi:hypothetical protein
MFWSLLSVAMGWDVDVYKLEERDEIGVERAGYIKFQSERTE